MTERSRGIAVAGAHRSVRSLAEGEGPFAGELVTRGDGVAVRVDAALLAGWPGWRFAGSEHVAAPEDLALRSDGQDALLPWCVRSAEAHLAQRAEEGGLVSGEAVTLAVSLLRGLAELGALDGADGDAPAGRWWLTEEGRPVFVIGAGSPPLSESGRLLETLEQGSADRALGRVLVRLRAALEEPRRLGAEAARWEQELLEIAAPRALRAPDAGDRISALRVVGPPARTRAVRRRDLRGAGRGRAGGARGLVPGGRAASGVRAVLGALVTHGAGLRRRAGEHRTPSPRPAPGAPRRRRWTGPAAVAVTAAAAVAVLGAVWPAGTSTSAADAADRTPVASASARPGKADGADERPSTPAATSAVPSARPARSPGPSQEQDPVVAATELIASARRCVPAPDPGCALLWDGGSPARDIRGDGAPPVLIEDYGDIAAVRNPAGDGAQMIVIIRTDDGWRIRDVYDIADPPSGGAETP